METTFNAPETDAAWQQIAPVLETAMDALNERDRQAVLLRYFEQRTLAEVGAALGMSEDGARLRVNRALDKLHAKLGKAGVTLGAALVASAVATHSVQSAPAALVAKVSVLAAKGAATTLSITTLVKGTLNIMAWTKAPTVVVASLGVLLVAGTTTVILEQTIQPTIEDSYFKTDSDSLQHKVPRNISIIRPTHFAKTDGGGEYWIFSNINRAVGRNLQFEQILGGAYDFSFYTSRWVLSANLPPGNFDFLFTKRVAKASDVKAELQNQIKKQFGLVGRKEMRETDVLLLKVKSTNAPQLKPSAGGGEGWGWGDGKLSCTNLPISRLALYLEGRFNNLPVLDQTGLTNNFDFNLVWDTGSKKRGNYPNVDVLKQALLNQLGLELVPSRESIEMLVVERVKY